MEISDRSPVLAPGRGAAWDLARQIQTEIESGMYESGDRLPAYRELMRQHCLTSGTVSYAMSLLADRGVIERRHGSGVYVRGPIARAIGAGMSVGLSALVVPEIESGLYLSLQAGMAAAVQQCGEQLITMTTGGSTSQQSDILLQLVDRKVSGIAIVPSYDTTQGYQLRHLHRLGVPFVLLHRGVPEVSAPLIDIPFAEVGRLAAVAIGEAGHRRVGAFLGQRSEATELYLKGFRQELEQLGIPLEDRWVLRSDSMLVGSEDYARHGQSIEKLIVTMLDCQNRPTALFVSFDRLAEFVYFAALRHGLKVPDDLSIVCFGGSRSAGPILPRITKIAVDEFRTGQQAYELLAAMRSGRLPIDCGSVSTMSATLDVCETLTRPST